MRTSHYRYPVRLSEEQRRWLETMVHLSNTPAKHYLVARVLLMSDQSQGGPSHTDGQIAGALSISRRTVIRIKQRPTGCATRYTSPWPGSGPAFDEWSSCYLGTTPKKLQAH